VVPRIHGTVVESFDARIYITASTSTAVLTSASPVLACTPVSALDAAMGKMRDAGYGTANLFNVKVDPRHPDGMTGTMAVDNSTGDTAHYTVTCVMPYAPSARLRKSMLLTQFRDSEDSVPHGCVVEARDWKPAAHWRKGRVWYFGPDYTLYVALPDIPPRQDGPRIRLLDTGDYTLIAKEDFIECTIEEPLFDIIIAPGDIAVFKVNGAYQAGRMRFGDVEGQVRFVLHEGIEKNEIDAFKIQAAAIVAGGGAVWYISSGDIDNDAAIKLVESEIEISTTMPLVVLGVIAKHTDIYYDHDTRELITECAVDGTVELIVQPAFFDTHSWCSGDAVYMQLDQMENKVMDDVNFTVYSVEYVPHSQRSKCAAYAFIGHLLLDVKDLEHTVAKVALSSPCTSTVYKS
jgi:hypothetical protein